jgi:hypothetical protein
MRECSGYQYAAQVLPERNEQEQSRSSREHTTAPHVVQSAQMLITSVQSPAGRHRHAETASDRWGHKASPQPRAQECDEKTR